MRLYDNQFGIFREEQPRPKAPKGMRTIERPKPPVHHYSYSNPNSQGALICETRGFPDWYDPETQEFHVAYSDRIAQWDRERGKRACELAGGGDQNWAYCLRRLPEERLKEFAKVALNLDSMPLHVQVIHHYNVSNGYSCPTVGAIVQKPVEDAEVA